MIDPRSVLILLLLSVGFFASAQTSAAQAVEEVAVSEDVVVADSMAVISREHAAALALAHISGAATPSDSAEVLLGGTSVQDTGAYWIVTVTRLGLTVLDRARIVAVSKADGKVRDLMPSDHTHEHDEPSDDRPRRFR